MARIHEEHIIIKVSKLAADGAEVQMVVTDELRAAIEAVAKELLFETVGTHIVIEAIDPNA
jgi:hypothetical protein